MSVMSSAPSATVSRNESKQIQSDAKDCETYAKNLICGILLIIVKWTRKQVGFTSGWGGETRRRRLNMSDQGCICLVIDALVLISTTVSNRKEWEDEENEFYADIQFSKVFLLDLLLPLKVFFSFVLSLPPPPPPPPPPSSPLISGFHWSAFAC